MEVKVCVFEFNDIEDFSFFDNAVDTACLLCTKDYNCNENDCCSDQACMGMKVTNGQVVIDESKSFSAMINYDRATIQVLKSKWVVPATPASPCYPGQVTPAKDGLELGFSTDPKYLRNDLLYKEKIYVFRNKI